MSKYEYNIINYWNNSDDLYVNYVVIDKERNEKINCIEYYNVSDIDCNYNESNIEQINKSLLGLLKKNNGLEFKIPKVSELSSLLVYIYDYVCDSEADMCHIDYSDWEELKDERFNEKDIDILCEEIKKYSLDDYINIDDGEYKICAYGGLQTMFADDREKGGNELER